MTFLLAFRNLFRNPRRTLAILLTLALGASALFAFQGFIYGLLNDYKNSTIHSQYGHGQVYPKDYRDTVYQEPWKYWIEEPDELITYLEEQKDIEYVFPRVGFSALLKKDGVTVSGSGQGVKAETERHFFQSLNIEEGEMLTTQERGIILGRGLANALDIKPGQTVDVVVNATDGSISKRNFIVTGIFHSGIQEFDSRIFRIQLPEAQSLLKTDKVESVALGLKSDDRWDHVAKELEESHPELDAIPFNVLDKVYYQHSVDWLNAQFHIIRVIIIGIVLLGIFNTVSTSILERKQEIGNLRANGESVYSVMKLILVEGALLGVIGSLLGIALTYFVITLLLNKAFIMPPGPGQTKDVFVSFQFNWSMFMSTFFISVISAIAASAVAGIKVAKMPIAKALRSH